MRVRACAHDCCASRLPLLSLCFADLDVDTSLAARPDANPSSSPLSSAAITEENVATVASMGIPEAHARFALARTDNNVERAIDWYFSHMEEIDVLMTSAATSTNICGAKQNKFRDGRSVYRLVGLVSHMGSSCASGHYVAHLERQLPPNTAIEGAAGGSRPVWVLYNDEKVARSENPPTDLAYLYLFRRL
jgi:ubiquitin carboxyl-terminal hydrolase 5/13